MDKFDFLLVIIGIVVGLALATLLDGVVAMVALGGQIKISWPTILWAAICFLLLLHYWWFLWVNRKTDIFEFFRFALFLIFPTCLYIVSKLIFPEMRGSEGIAGIDLAAHFDDHALKIYLIGIIGLAGWALCDIFTYGGIQLEVLLLYRVVPVGLLATGMACAHIPGAHLILAIVMALLLCFVLLREQVPLE